jgi:NTP pyrophosphatase (non-canonical NTP hydrolase)
METPNDIVNQLNTTCTAALKQWGATAQLAKFHEEICECSVAITHGYSRGHVRLECADVIIMAWQMALNHADSPDDVLSAIREKLSRLNERIATDAAARSAILELNGEVHQ